MAVSYVFSGIRDNLVSEGTPQDVGNTYLRIGWLQSKHGPWFQFLVLT